MIADWGFLTTGNALRDGSKFPTIGRVLEIKEPFATQIQAAVVPARFGGGIDTLLLRDATGEVTVIDLTGDTSPGIADGRTISSFEAPVATRFPSGPMSVASIVALSDGSKAIFLQKFSEQAPPIETGRLVTLIGGAAKINGDPVMLTSYTPLKLTNDNRLLLEASIGESKEILVLPNPF